MSKMHSAKKLVIDFILVMLGNAIMALGTAGFAVPAKIILGGVSGLALHSSIMCSMFIYQHLYL